MGDKIRDLNNYPFRTLRVIDLQTKKPYDLKGVPMGFNKMGSTVRVDLEFWSKEISFNTYEPSLKTWKWTHILTAEEIETYKELIKSLEDGALKWLKVDSKEWQIISLAIDLTVCSIGVSAIEINRPSHSTGDNAVEDFNDVITSNPTLVTTYQDLIWSLAKDNDAIYGEFK